MEVNTTRVICIELEITFRQYALKQLGSHFSGRVSREAIFLNESGQGLLRKIFPQIRRIATIREGKSEYTNDYNIMVIVDDPDFIPTFQELAKSYIADFEARKKVLGEGFTHISGITSIECNIEYNERSGKRKK